jgi:hypothetical protein
MPKAKVYEPVAGSGDRGSACIGNERNLALFQLDDQLRRLGNFIVFVITDHPLLNFEVKEASVSGGVRTQSSTFQDAGAQRNVFQVSN